MNGSSPLCWSECALSQSRGDRQQAMRIIITRSSGPTGTNPALRLLKKGHEVVGVDWRANSRADKFIWLLQDRSGHSPSQTAGIGEVECPIADLVVHLTTHAKANQSAEASRCYDWQSRSVVDRIHEMAFSIRPVSSSKT